MRYITARRQGVELHIEVDTSGSCEVDSLGAERIVVSGESASAIRVAGSRVRAPIGIGAPASAAAPPLEVG